MLSPSEIQWLDSYHRTVIEKIGPNLSGSDREWLEQACAPI